MAPYTKLCPLCTHFSVTQLAFGFPYLSSADTHSGYATLAERLDMMLLLTSSATVTARAAFAMTTRTTRPAAATAVAGFGRRRLRMREGAGGRELALQPFRKLNGLVPASDGDARSASPQLPLSAPSSADDDRPWTWSTPSPVRRGRGSTTELAKKPRYFSRVL